ncbi:hypothetical protein Bca101_081485 [Brassica carinata]
MIPLTTFLDHDTLVFRSYDLSGASPRTMVHPDDPTQDRGHDKSPPLDKDSSSNPVLLISCLIDKMFQPISLHPEHGTCSIGSF